jgi:electron transfer flavoprotein alpha subunit
MTDHIYVLIEHLQGSVSDISYMNLAAARGLADATGGEVVAVLLGHNAKDLAANLAADRVLYADHPQLAEFSPEAYRISLAALLKAEPPRVLLMGDTSVGADIAGGLSANLDIPLISLCRSVHAEGAKLSYVSQICGGKILAQGEIPDPTSLITMVPGEYKIEAGQSETAPPVSDATTPDLDGLRVSLKNYIEPEVGDVDIAREPVLIAVGRGIQQEINLEYAEDLAAELNAVLCASRPVVDQGWLDTSRLVGKSGKRVNPKIYLSMGISGAPEHAEGIGDSELFIAINTDPQAPIFDMADYGAAEDLFELVPALTEKIKAAKGG